MRKLLLLLALMVCISGCAPGSNDLKNVPDGSGKVATFGVGVINGFISGYAMVLSCFSDNYQFYKANNSGRGYNGGFFLGLLLSFLSGILNLYWATKKSSMGCLILIGQILLVVAFVPDRNPLINVPDEFGNIANFWDGLWHAIIAPFTLLASIFTDQVNYYEVHNNGQAYNGGFFVGNLLMFFVTTSILFSMLSVLRINQAAYQRIRNREQGFPPFQDPNYPFNRNPWER